MINLKNRSLYVGQACDNLQVMQGINSNSIDLIATDPPFNSKKNYAAPLGSEAAGQAFTDTWSPDDVKEWWKDDIEFKYPALYRVLNASADSAGASMGAYLIYMSMRLIEMQRILKPTGSLYLHCDTTASHYLKQILDCIFGFKNFKNEIIWSYRRWSGKARRYQRMHDVILFYGGGVMAKLRGIGQWKLKHQARHNISAGMKSILQLANWSQSRIKM